MVRITKYALCICLLVSSPSAFPQYAFQKLLLNAEYPGGSNAQRSPSGDLTFTTWAFDQYATSGYDIMLLSLNVQGDTLWSKIYRRPFDDRSYTLLATTDGGYLIVGSTARSDTMNSPQDVYLIKTNSLGDTLWTRVYQRSNHDLGIDAIECFGGGFLVVGSPAGDGMYLIRTNNQGDLMWAERYDRHDPPDFDSQVSPWSVTQAGDSTFFVAGNRWSSAFLSHIDSNGSLLSTKLFYEANEVNVRQVEATSDGGVILLGERSAGLQRDFLLIKSDSWADVTWAKAYGSTEDEWPYSLLHLSNGGFAMTGVTRQADPLSSDVYLIKTDDAGEVLWSGMFGDTEWDVGRDLVETSDTSLFLVGWTQSFGFNSATYLIHTALGGAANCHQDSAIALVTDVILNSVDLELQSFSSTTAQYPGVCDVTSGATLLPLCPLGVNDVAIDERSTRVFPNPARDQFTVSIPSNYVHPVLEIFNAVGHRVYHAIIDRTENTIDRGSLPSGIYLVRVSSDGLRTSEKIVLE